MFPHTSHITKGLLAASLICLTLLVFTIDAQAQYEPRKPTTGTTAQQASLTVTEPAAGTAWTKGKRYEITWKSEGIRGGVKIELIDPQGKATVLTRQTMNSGKYSFMLMQNVADGAYKIRISTVDNKTVGETKGTVQVGKIVDDDQKALVADTDPPVVVTRPTGVVGIVDQTPTTLTPDIGTVVREPIQLDDSREITDISGEGLVQLGNLTPIQVPDQDLQSINEALVGQFEAMTGLQDLEASVYTPAGPSLEVISIGAQPGPPGLPGFWRAGTRYPIRWASENLDQPIKIDLVHAVSAQQYDFYPISVNTPNDGSFDHTAPAMLGCGPHGFWLQLATLDDQVKAFGGPIDFYHEPVDMTCSVSGLRQREDEDNYIVHSETDEWMEFYVLVRNNGTQQSTTIQTVRVLVVKEPEEVVIDGGHLEFGLGNMAPCVWYKTPDPLKYNISHSATWTGGGTQVNLRAGAYRVEVMADPMNLLREDEPMRLDNTIVQRFTIE